MILLEMGGTIYNTHTIEALEDLNFDSQRVKKQVKVLKLELRNKLKFLS
jgi:hypothetical protein